MSGIITPAPRNRLPALLLLLRLPAKRPERERTRRNGRALGSQPPTFRNMHSTVVWSNSAGRFRTYRLLCTAAAPWCPAPAVGGDSISGIIGPNPSDVSMRAPFPPAGGRAGFCCLAGLPGSVGRTVPTVRPARQVSVQAQARGGGGGGAGCSCRVCAPRRMEVMYAHCCTSAWHILVPSGNVLARASMVGQLRRASCHACTVHGAAWCCKDPDRPRWTSQLLLRHLGVLGGPGGRPPPRRPPLPCMRYTRRPWCGTAVWGAAGSFLRCLPPHAAARGYHCSCQHHSRSTTGVHWGATQGQHGRVAWSMQHAAWESCMEHAELAHGRVQEPICHQKTTTNINTSIAAGHPKAKASVVPVPIVN